MALLLQLRRAALHLRAPAPLQLLRGVGGPAARHAASDASSLSPDPEGGGGRGRKKPQRSAPRVKEAKTVSEEVEARISDVKKSGGVGSFTTDWRKTAIHAVPHRFRMSEPQRDPSAVVKPAEGAKSDKPSSAPAPGGDQKKNLAPKKTQPLEYTDYSGLRFPTLETAENYDYYKDRGLDRIIERAYPIKVPGYRRLDPYLREYIHFLHKLDPARFTTERIAERYRLRTKTVAKVVQEWGTNLYLTRSGLTRLRDKQTTKEAVILVKKEQQYAKWVGYDQLGDEDDPETDDETLGEFKGWRSTSDWVRRQSVEVEMMHAFPMSEKRDPMPKRTDVDLVVGSEQHHKIINWIDPTDKVVF